MRRLIIILGFTLIVIGAYGQGLFNKGALIVIQTGALVKVDGDANGNYTNSTGLSDGRIDINGVMNLEGNWTNNSTLGNHVFINIGTNGTVVFSGTTQQWVGGTTFTDFENVTLNNASGAQMMVDVNRVNGTLNLTNGPLRLNNFTLIQNNTLAASVIHGAGYLVSESEASKFQWNIGANTGSYTYPFGVTSAYIPFIASISAASGTNMTVSTWHTGVNNITYPSGVTNMDDITGDISVPKVADRFWVPVYSGYTANFHFTYDNVSGTNDIGILSESSLLAQYWDGVGWVTPLFGVNDYTNDNVNSVPGQSHPWVLADMNGPLPVKLLSFDAKCNKDDVVVSWSTATESNNDYFTLERSLDAVNWQAIAEIDGAGNSNEVLHYEFIDKESVGGLSYYRLKQTDFDGKNEVFSPVSVVCSSDDQSDINIYPNPFKQEVIISYSNLMAGKGSVKVYDMLGNIVVDKIIELSLGSQNYVLDLSSLASGLYDVGFVSGNNEYHKRLVKN
jgi:hypothetical protein